MQCRSKVYQMVHGAHLCFRDWAGRRCSVLFICLTVFRSNGAISLVEDMCFIFFM